MASILYEYTPAELQTLLDNSAGYCDVLRKVGLNAHGSNHQTLKNIINEYGLDTTKCFDNRKKLYSNNARETHLKTSYSLESILNNEHPKYQSSKLLKRLIEEGYKEQRCEICGITEWNNIPIVLQLHHIDGNHINNNIDNLQILCPNCHSQTDNFSGKNTMKEHNKINVYEVKERKNSENKSKKPLPLTREELKEKIRNCSFVKIAEEYGVSDNAIRKWCDRYGLPRKVSEIHNITDEEWKYI